MKKLQNNVTTPEQSKKLLKLGILIDSADMYYNRYMYDKWWKCMLIPLKDIPQEDLEWAALECDKFNSYCSKKIFLQEIERRKYGYFRIRKNIVL